MRSDAANKCRPQLFVIIDSSSSSLYAAMSSVSDLVLLTCYSAVNYRLMLSGRVKNKLSVKRSISHYITLQIFNVA